MNSTFGWTKSSGIDIAYQIVGNGILDLLLVPSYVSHLEQIWEEPAYARFLNSIASFSRLIIFDKRGTGLSGRTGSVPSLEERMDDIRSVMDAVGSKRAVLLGGSEGGMISILFAATYPDRVSHLVLYGTTAKFLADDSYPWGMPLRVLQDIIASAYSVWGTGKMAVPTFAPSRANDPHLLAWSAKFERLSATPYEFQNYMLSLAELDLRPILPAIHVPTLVLHRTNDKAVNVKHAQYIASHIKAAKYVEMVGEDHWWFLGDSDRLVREIESFVTGNAPGTSQEGLLAIILFTDIVDSTTMAVKLGNQKWADLLNAYSNEAKRAIATWRGCFIKDTGDGLLATFDGPTRALKCAFEIQEASRSFGISIRAGLHVGEIIQADGDIRGIACHIASRIAKLASADEVLVSKTVKDIVAGATTQFRAKDEVILKGIPTEWELGNLYSAVRA